MSSNLQTHYCIDFVILVCQIKDKMERRKFIHASSMIGGTALVSSTQLLAQAGKSVNQQAQIKPKGLKKGDTIGLITPGSAVTRNAFEKAIENMEALGFKVKYSENMRVKKGFLAGTDQQRLDDLHNMFESPEINGIVCARGGYGSGRLLPHINYDLIKANPKVLVGYSDITALLFAIYGKTGLVCFHGPVGVSDFTDFTSEQFVKVLMKGKSKVKIDVPKSWEEIENPAFEMIKISDGTAIGNLVGGNLSLITAAMGTPYDLDFDGKIVFIEEIGESPYRIDRMLTQILNSGKLKNAKGLALGVFKNCETKPNDSDFDLSLSLKEVLLDRLSSLNIPVIYGLPIGHIDDNATLPFGIPAELDVNAGRLTILDTAVQ